MYLKKIRSRVEVEYIPSEEIAGDGFVRLEYFTPYALTPNNSKELGLASNGSNIGTGVVLNTLALNYYYELIQQKQFFQFKKINYSLICNVGFKSALFSHINGKKNYSEGSIGWIYFDNKYFVTTTLDSKIERQYNFF